MKERGYEHKGQMYRRYAGEVVQLFVFQSWHGNSANSYWFTANIQLRKQTPYNTSDIGRRDWYEDDVASHLLTERFGMLSRGRDYWYKMEQVSQQELAAALLSDLENSLIPFFDYCKTTDTILPLKGSSAEALHRFVLGLPRDS
jgi:hypothetical protein